VAPFVTLDVYTRLANQCKCEGGHVWLLSYRQMYVRGGPLPAANGCSIFAKQSGRISAVRLSLELERMAISERGDLSNFGDGCKVGNSKRSTFGSYTQHF